MSLKERKPKICEIKRDNFMAILGYHGNIALVDKKLKKSLSKKSLESLLEEGQYKAAFCRSFFSDPSERQTLLESYNTVSQSNYTLKNLEKLFGVFSVPTDMKKIKLI